MRRTPASAFEIHVIHTMEELELLREPWNELLRNVVGANPYQAPAYVVEWFRHFATNSGIHVITIRRAGRLVGVAPFEARPVRAARLGHLRLRSVAANQADYGEPLLAHDEPGLADALLDHLAAVVARPGSSVQLYGLRDDGVLLPALRDRGDLTTTPLRPPLPAAVLRFDALEDPVAHVDGIARKNDVARKLRKLGEKHDVSEVTDLDVEQGFEGLVELLDKRWSSGEGPREFASETRRRFTRSFVRGLARDGFAVIETVQADGRPVWMALTLKVNDRAVGQTLAIGQEFMKFGPGIIGVYQLLRDLAESGAVEMDMLSGDYEYKKRWANYERVSYSYLVLRDSAVGRVHLRARELRDWRRSTKRRLRLKSRIREVMSRPGASS